MVKDNNNFVICVRLHGSDFYASDEANALAGEPVARRLNRIERVAMSFDGKLVRRANTGLLIAFKTANHAVLAACEIQRRCADMPQLSSSPIKLVIGIHKASPEDEAINTPIIKRSDRRNIKRRFGFDTAGRLASAKDEDAIIISGLVHNLIDQPLKDITSALPEGKAEIRAFLVDWKAPIDWQHASQSSRLVNDPPQCKLLLQHGAKQIELTKLDGIATFGRDPGCDIMIGGSYVSRIHARVEIRPEGCFLTDQSVNGTTIRPTNGGELLVKQTSYPLTGSGQLVFGNASERRVNSIVAFFVLEAGQDSAQMADGQNG